MSYGKGKKKAVGTVANSNRFFLRAHPTRDFVTFLHRHT